MENTSLTPEELRAERDSFYQQKRISNQAKAARNTEIMRLRFEEKLTLQKIAKRFGLTRQRVKQIIDDF